jgi:putative endonuclease
MCTYCVYILANTQRTLYVGVTRDLRRRVYEHKAGRVPGFTRRYCVNRLVWFEADRDARAAITLRKAAEGLVARAEGRADRV